MGACSGRTARASWDCDGIPAGRVLARSARIVHDSFASMPTIYDRDFTNYSDEDFISDVDHLVQSKMPEGPTLEYKADLSEQDGWLQDLVAFANSYGGILIIGVVAKNGIPQAAPGFERPSEVAVDIGNQVNSCVQPRPDFELKVARCNDNSGRWLAGIQVREGVNTPYLYSRTDKRRIYVRGPANKIEPDYLQLMRLIEKRSLITNRAGRIGGEIQRVRNLLQARQTGNLSSSTWYKFVAAADLDLAIRLTHTHEERFERAVLNTFAVDREHLGQLRAIMNPEPLQWQRDVTDSSLSYFFIQEPGGQKSFDRRWLLSSGSIAFATVASHEVAANQTHFSFVDFIYDLLSFLRLVRLHFNSVRYFGEIQVWTDLMFQAPGAQPVHTGILYTNHVSFRHPSDCLGVGRQLAGQSNAGSRIAMQPFSSDNVLFLLRELLNMIARGFGGVLSDTRRSPLHAGRALGLFRARNLRRHSSRASRSWIRNASDGGWPTLAAGLHM
jgi:hypothetical protein